jgi:hypothetical protein
MGLRNESHRFGEPALLAIIDVKNVCMLRPHVAIARNSSQDAAHGAVRRTPQPERGDAMDMVSLLVSLVSGAVGGNIVGAAMKDKSLGGLGNTIAGLIGGGAGGWIMGAMGLLGKMAPAAAGAASGGMDIGAIIANVAGSGIGGAILAWIVSYFKGQGAK